MRAAAVCVVCLPLVACADAQRQGAGEAPPAPVTAPPTTAATAATVDPAPAEAPGAAARTPGDVGAGALSGTVLEALDSGGYTYLRLQAPHGETWAAVPQASVRKGAVVTVDGSMPMDGFTSPTLKRRFDHIVFGSLKVERVPPPEPRLPPNHPPLPGRAVDLSAIDVERAPGPDGRTVAELHAQRQALADKPVVVRAKVVKFRRGIMGRNWLHLRDGSGSAEAHDDDLTVTTLETLEVGDEVTLGGTVRVDKDFGAGYRYPVMLEEGKRVP